jgi:hypothetical protein
MIKSALASRLAWVGRGFLKASRLLNPPTGETRGVRAQVQSGSLLHYAADVWSQNGDDGILREILRRVGIQTGFFIEFGAFDPILLSQTRLLYEKGWSGMLIEGDQVRAARIKSFYANVPGMICLEGMVFADKHPFTLDDYCDRHGVTGDPEFVSIDVDGLDLNIFESMKRHPKVIAIEGGGSWHPEMKQRVPDDVAAQNLQQPVEVMIQSVKNKGYEPVCWNANLYAVDAAFAGLFTDCRHDAVSLWLDGYWSLPRAKRQSLLAFRQANALIKDQEKPYAPDFSIDLVSTLP